MIILKKLVLKNWLSHKDTIIDFKGKEKILLEGKSGSGKSSIVDAIIFAIYGESRSDNKSMVTKGEKKCSVSLTLIDTSSEYETINIVRSITSGGKHSIEILLEKDGNVVSHPVQGVRDLQKWIEESVMGMSYILFINSIAYIQNGSDTFVQQTASRRKDILMELINIADIDHYYSDTKNAISNLNNELNTLYGERSQLEQLIVDKSILKPIIESKFSEKSELEKSIKISNLLVEELQVKKASITSNVESIHVIDSNIKSCKDSIVYINSRIANLYNDLSKKEDLEIEILKLPALTMQLVDECNKCEKLKNDVFKSVEKKEEYNKFLMSKPSKYDGSSEKAHLKMSLLSILDKKSCPSGDDCPFYSDILSSLNFIENRIKEIDQLEIDINRVLESWEADNVKAKASVDQNTNDIILLEKESEEKIRNINKEISFINECKNSLEKMSSYADELSAFKNDLIEKEKSLESLEKNKSIFNSDTLTEELAQINTSIQKELDAISSINTKISLIYVEISKIEESIKLSDASSLKLKEINEIKIPPINDNIRKLELLKGAFGSKGGIKTIVIDFFLESLERKVNEVLSQLSDFTVRFDTQKKGSDGETNIEGLWIIIKNDIGEELDYANYSGGEKLRITIAISEALASLSKGVSFRIMDEMIVGLSPEMVQDFTLVLEKLQSKYDQILFISHLPEAKSMFEDVISVKKRLGVSVISRFDK